MVFLIPSPVASVPGAHSDSGSEESVDLSKAQEICLTRRRSVGGADARLIMSADEAASMRKCHQQNVQLKSHRSLGVILGEPRDTHAHAAKSSTPQARRLPPIGRNHSRAGQGPPQTAAKSVTFMTGVRTIMKACAILWQKLNARFSERTFGNRVLVSRVATHLDIRDRVLMQTGCLSQVPEPSNSVRHAPSEFAHLSKRPNCTNVTCDRVTVINTVSTNHGGFK
jgi:hypothetical protein